MNDQLKRLVAVVAAIACSCLFALTPSWGITILTEDFNGLALKDSVEEGVAGPIGDGGGAAATGVWTDVAPAGWIVDKTGVPGYNEPPDNNGVVEWSGWNFAARDWWMTTAGDQRRHRVHQRQWRRDGGGSRRVG